MSKSLRRTLAFIALVPAVVFSHFVLSKAFHRAFDRQELTSVAPEEGRRKWDPRLFQILSFGHLPSAVDWLMIRFLIIDPSSKHVAPGTHPSVFYDLDLATDLDPIFFELYTAGANYLTVIRNDNEGAKELLLKGDRFRRQLLPSFPEEFQARFWRRQWQIPLLLAYVYLFEMDDMPEAARQFLEAAALPGSPAYLDRLAIRLQKPGGQYEVGLKLLNLLIDGTKAPDVRERMVRKRDSLFLGQYLFHLNDAFRAYLQEKPKYRAKHEVDERGMQQYFRQFLADSRTPPRDPWGGELSVDAGGKINSSTPRERVMGLE